MHPRPSSCAAGLSLLLLALTPAAGQARGTLDDIEHIIVISLENHSFDNLFGFFPGAEGIPQAQKENIIQTDRDGKPYDVLPPIPDNRFPADLPNEPFPIERYVPIHKRSVDLTHRFFEHIDQINGGRNDRFAAVSGAGGLVMGYYDGRQLGMWKYAQQYTLADHFFQAAFGGSFINHFWLICACTARYDNPPQHLINDGLVTPDGYVVNNMRTAQLFKNMRGPAVPPQTRPNIGDRLTGKGISWAWYADGWNDMVSGNPSSDFRYHHQPFLYFANYARGTPGWNRNLKDKLDFLRDLKEGTLPAVSFYKPLGEFNLHPGSSSVLSGDEHLVEILQAIEASPVWNRTVVIVTFDENGGYWDHVPPPVVDRFGPGSRVPTLIISPLAKKGFVDKTVYDTTSILRLIEKRFDLEPLTARDAVAGDLTNALDIDTGK